MPSVTFSAYHEYVATTLAREMTAYFAHSERMSCYFKQRDIRGNPPVYTHRDRAETEERRLKVIVFCAIYVEALANLYLSLKLTTVQFAAIERVEIIEKWATIPSLFLPTYSIPRSKPLWRDLKTLVAQRNAIAHMKPRITARGEIVHEGNLPKKIQIHSQIEHWDSLPSALVENLGVHDNSPEYMKFKVLSHVDEYAGIRAKDQRQA
jgi:hypothetical protein